MREHSGLRSGGVLLNSHEFSYDCQTCPTTRATHVVRPAAGARLGQRLLDLGASGEGGGLLREVEPLDCDTAAPEPVEAGGEAGRPPRTGQRCVLSGVFRGVRSGRASVGHLGLQETGERIRNASRHADGSPKRKEVQLARRRQARAAPGARGRPRPFWQGLRALGRQRRGLTPALRSSDTDILDHCRHPGPHGRGCWVVDLLTGRT
jgi:hypothetical protein